MSSAYTFISAKPCHFIKTVDKSFFHISVATRFSSLSRVGAIYQNPKENSLLGKWHVRNEITKNMDTHAAAGGGFKMENEKISFFFQQLFMLKNRAINRIFLLASLYMQIFFLSFQFNCFFFTVQNFLLLKNFVIVIKNKSQYKIAVSSVLFIKLWQWL